jgi:hypothetical protein
MRVIFFLKMHESTAFPPVTMNISGAIVDSGAQCRPFRAIQSAVSSLLLSTEAVISKWGEVLAVVTSTTPSLQQSATTRLEELSSIELAAETVRSTKYKRPADEKTMGGMSRKVSCSRTGVPEFDCQGADDEEKATPGRRHIHHKSGAILRREPYKDIAVQ